MASGKIFTVHEKTEAPEPADRVLLVREGFSYAAFVFSVFWLLANRLWGPAFGYVIAMVALHIGGQEFGVSPVSVVVLQLLLQVLVAANAYDLKRMQLAHQGYREAGVLVAESAIAAEQRYYEHAA